MEKTKPADRVPGYSILLHNQNTIFGKREDLKALHSGLKQLPNLKRVMVSDCFEYPLDYHPSQWDTGEFDRFLRWSGKAFRDIASPAAWSMANCLENGTHFKKSPWDFRGIQNLLTAIEEQAPQLRHFSFGCQRSWLSATSFDREDDAKALRRVLCQLIHFNMLCRDPDTQESLQGSNCVGAATCIIREAKHLESLTLTLDGSVTDWAMIHNGIRSSGLKILDLSAGDIDSQTLRATVIAHRETLRELRLHSMHLMDGGSWEEISNQLGGSLQLHCVTLMSISDEHGRLWCYKCDRVELRAVKTAAHFMQRTPHQLQKIAAAGIGLVIAWNSEVFRPRFDLDRFCDDFYSREDIQ